jgi:hypothetical protein
VLNEINRNPARIKKLIRNIDIDKLWFMLAEQHQEELSKYKITKESMPQLMTTIAAMSVFPFAARGILEGVFEKLGVSFESFLEERKTFAADFVINAIKERARR